MGIALGKVFPGWRIVGDPIGSGSFGKVYRIVKEDGFGGRVYSALKIITIPESGAELKAYRDDGYDDDSLTTLLMSQVKDITSEFLLMNRLKGNGHIVSYEDHAIIQHENDPGYDILIRMELLTALPEYYAQLCQEKHRAWRVSIHGQVEEAIAVKLGIDICKALELCRQNNIIHRDIKPQNIFISKVGDFKLGDFGVARVSDHTTHATKAGTYEYMAPEVYSARPYNGSADVYSLGMVLYWLLNDRRGPFLPLPPNTPTANQKANALARRMQGGRLPEPRLGSRELKRIVLKACAADPKLRYASAAEMQYDLEQIRSLSDDAADAATAEGTIGGVNRRRQSMALPPPDLNLPTGPSKTGSKSHSKTGSQRKRALRKSHKREWIIGAAAGCVLLLGIALIAGILFGKKGTSGEEEAELTSVRRPRVTSTPLPTFTPIPTFTSAPTFTPTPTPSPTPSPTSTPMPEAKIATILHCNNEANVRKDPNSGSEKLGTLPWGRTVKVLGISGDWAMIEYKGGVAYVYSEYVVVHRMGTIVNVNNRVTVRRAPDEESERLGAINKGKSVEIIEIDGDWAMIVYESGIAYIHSKFVRLDY